MLADVVPTDQCRSAWKGGKNGAMLRRLLALVVGIAVAGTVAGCAAPNSLSAPAPSGVPAPTRTESFEQSGEGEQLVVRSGETELHVESMDAAVNLGPVPADLPAVVADDIYVFVRPAGWTLTAMQFTGDPYECGERSIEPEQRDLGGGWWAIRPLGPQGEYTLLLTAGSGPGLPLGGEVGAASAYLALETRTDRALPPPAATLDVSAIEGEGAVGLYFAGLTESPDTSSATVTFTTADGATTPVVLAPTADCNLTGELSFSADLGESESNALADGPFDYDIELVLDGQTYVAGGVAQDANTIADPTFTPALP